MKTILFSLMMLLTASAFAGDRAASEAIGFSADGQYFSYMEYGTHDGSAHPFATVFFIDVEKNQNAILPVRVSFDDTKTEGAARAEALAQAKANLEKLGVQPQSATKINAQLYGWNTVAVFTLTKDQQKLEIARIPASHAECVVYGKPTYLVGARLNGVVIYKENNADLVQLRDCPTDYTIRDLYTNATKNRVVLILDMTTPGYEGPNVRTTAIGIKL